MATEWVRFGSDWIDQAERTAARMSDEWGAEMDVQTGTVFPSGRVASRERAGVRVAA